LTPGVPARGVLANFQGNSLLSFEFVAGAKRERSMRSYLLGAALLGVLTAPALAEDFYIVQNPTTKQCTIVTEKPTTTTGVGSTTYTTRTEAQNALKTTEVCTTTKSATTTTTSDDEDE